MEAKYKASIKAGIIGGVLIVICITFSIISNLLQTLRFIGVINLILAIIIITVGTGALSVKFATGAVMKLEGAVGISTIAGTIAAGIFAVFEIVGTIINAYLNHVSIYTPSYGDPNILTLIGTCLCFPCVFLVVLAIFGGVLYGLKLNLE